MNLDFLSDFCRTLCTQKGASCIYSFERADHSFMGSFLVTRTQIYQFSFDQKIEELLFKGIIHLINRCLMLWPQDRDQLTAGDVP